MYVCINDYFLLQMSTVIFDLLRFILFHICMYTYVYVSTSICSLQQGNAATDLSRLLLERRSR